MLYAKDKTKEQHVVLWLQAYKLGFTILYLVVQMLCG